MLVSEHACQRTHVRSSQRGQIAPDRRPRRPTERTSGAITTSATLPSSGPDCQSTAAQPSCHTTGASRRCHCRPLSHRVGDRKQGMRRRRSCGRACGKAPSATGGLLLLLLLLRGVV